MRSAIMYQVEVSLKSTATTLMAAYDQNSGDYLEAKNGSIWKGGYNMCQGTALVRRAVPVSYDREDCRMAAFSAS